MPLRVNSQYSGPATNRAMQPAAELPDPSPQQEEFLRQLRGTDAHILLEARAGSGKSTTCCMAAHLLHSMGRKSVYAAFNQHIAREIGGRLPWSCPARTLHSIGFQAIKDSLGDVQVDQDKLDRLGERWFPGREYRVARTAAGRLVSLAKSLALDTLDPEEAFALAADYGVDIPADIAAEVHGVAGELLEASRADDATIDFDDMIDLPIRAGLRAARQPDVIFVDEAQDLNAAQQELLATLFPAARVIVVGDRHQAIYAWRGADDDAIANFEARLSADGRGLVRAPLTITRRCPRRHVEAARRIVPDLEHLPEAILGEIFAERPEKYSEWLVPGELVLCRSNAPLVSACYRLIRSGRRATVRGRDIGKGLLAFIARFRVRAAADLMARVEDYRASEGAKLAAGCRNPAPALQSLNDRCDTLIALCEGCLTVDEVRSRAETMFSDLDEQGAVIFSTVHRAKGLERDRITILRPDLLPGPWAHAPEDRKQEFNLIYVAATRSRRTLTFAGDPPSILFPDKSQLTSSSESDSHSCH